MSEFSKSALKQFRRLPKEEMLRILVELSNYAEEQKAMSMILISRMKEMEQYVSKEDLDKVNKLMKGEKTKTESVDSEKTEVSDV
jgi:hypothetical protein